VLTSAQISAGIAVVLNIQGSAKHSHTAALSGAEVRQIGNGQRVSVFSSDEGHSHSVTFD
jgi:hypothetical protein